MSTNQRNTPFYAASHKGKLGIGGRRKKKTVCSLIPNEIETRSVRVPKRSELKKKIYQRKPRTDQQKSRMIRIRMDRKKRNSIYENRDMGQIVLSKNGSYQVVVPHKKSPN